MPKVNFAQAGAAHYMHPNAYGQLEICHVVETDGSPEEIIRMISNS